MKKQKLTAIWMLLCILCLNSHYAYSGVKGTVIIPDSVLAQRNVTLGELLRGRVAGLQVLNTDGAPGGAFDLIIRGGGTMRNGVLPLIYLDGVALNPSTLDVINSWSKIDNQDYQAVQSLLNGIYSQDIEDIEILSDVAQTAKYGSSGANGVIIIKTKKGKDGKNLIEVNSNVGISTNSLNNFFRSGLNHNQNVTIQGNQRRTNYYISGTLSQHDGVVDKSGTNDLGLNVRLDQLINERSKLGAQILFSNSKISMIQATSMPGGTSLITQLNNPVGSVETPANWLTDYDDDMSQWRITPQLSYSYRIVGGLSFNVLGGLDYVNKTRFRWLGNSIERGLVTNSRAGESQLWAVNYTVNPELKYNLFFAKKHELNLSLNGSIIGKDETLIGNCGTNFTVPSLRAKGIGFASQSYQIDYLRNKNSTYQGGFFVDYQYDKKVNMYGGVHISQMPKYDQGKINYYPFSEISLKLITPKETGTLTDAGLKLSWGISGFNKIGNYTQIAGLLGDANISYNLPSNALLYYFPQLNTKNNEINIGADVKLFDNKVKMGVNYYNSHITENLSIQSYQPDTIKVVYRPETQDTITTIVPIDDTFSVNDMTMRRQGIEITISATVIKNSNSDLLLSGNVSWSQNKVNGKSSTLFYGYEDENSTEQTIIGSANPSLLFGFQTSYRFKALSLFANFDGVVGNQILNMNGYTSGKILKNRVENGSFLRFSNLSISYKAPLKITKWIKELSFNVVGSNLFTLTKYTGYSPDVNSYIGKWNQRGVDYGAYPSYSTFSLGCSAKF